MLVNQHLTIAVLQHLMIFSRQHFEFVIAKQWYQPTLVIKRITDRVSIITFQPEPSHQLFQ